MAGALRVLVIVSCRLLLIVFALMVPLNYDPLCCPLLLKAGNSAKAADAEPMDQPTLPPLQVSAAFPALLLGSGTRFPIWKPQAAPFTLSLEEMSFL